MFPRGSVLVGRSLGQWIDRWFVRELRRAMACLLLRSVARALACSIGPSSVRSIDSSDESTIVGLIGRPLDHLIGRPIVQPIDRAKDNKMCVGNKDVLFFKRYKMTQKTQCSGEMKKYKILEL